LAQNRSTVCYGNFISIAICANDIRSAIKAEEKNHIKTRALEAGIVEPAPLLALHNSLMIAKIMRFEFPQDWYVRHCYVLVSEVNST
jgi:hypothetical protein